MEIAKFLDLFILAGLCEIGGGYLVWIWLRYREGILIGVLGGIINIIYGVVPTHPSQPILREPMQPMRVSS